MDFYVDLGVAVLLRLIKDRRNVRRYYDALAKIFVKLQELIELDKGFAEVVESAQKKR